MTMLLSFQVYEERRETLKKIKSEIMKENYFFYETYNFLFNVVLVWKISAKKDILVRC